MGRTLPALREQLAASSEVSEAHGMVPLHFESPGSVPASNDVYAVELTPSLPVAFVCRSGIQAMAAAVAAPSRLGLAQVGLPRPGVPLLYIAAGRQEVSLWDVLDGQCHQVRHGPLQVSAA